MFSSLILDTRDKIATITLNRPDVYNAFNDALSFELQDALKQVEKDKEVRAVVLTGAGKAFCSGQDLKAAQERSEERRVGKECRSRWSPYH